MIIEAFPVSSRQEYNKRLIHMGITGASMIIPFAAFITGMFNNPENIGTLAELWVAALTIAMPKVMLDLRGLERLKKLDSSGIQTTYTKSETVSSVKQDSKGGNRLLRLIPPGLRAGIPARRFK